MLSYFPPPDLRTMDLFHFTMQQLAPTPVSGREGDAHTLPSYLRHWLHRHYHTSEPATLLGSPPVGDTLPLDAGARAKLAHDLEGFYGVPILVSALATLHTLPEVEAHLEKQLVAGAH